MNKEELLKPIMEMVKFGGDCQEAQKMFNEFFKSNVCIPKGDNRQECADEIHAYAEGITVQRRSPSGWEDLAPYGMPLRIKPSEPIYEWQYLITTMFGASENKLSKFLTDDEFTSMARSRSEGWTKLEETKRERK